ncbi:MAG: imidazole glycerol phosphate synthase subunit HisH [Chitinophagaceae bacterium]|nr:imidazole glycerol phosphate synthase subunit HisH [Chitinophagaceae bacterium]
MPITIIDYGVGNLRSIQNMLKKIGIDVKISGRAEDIQSAEKLILPGVGHFDYGMQHLCESGLVGILNDEVLIKKKPILGICLGVQLLTQSSEEGNEKGLGWIKGKTVAFDRNRLSSGQKIPHMGWAEINAYVQSKLFTAMYDDPRFYFVHSYHLQLDYPEDVLAQAHYGYDFAAGIEHENIVGVQFHPEKSHKFGMKLLENFVKYY